MAHSIQPFKKLHLTTVQSADRSKIAQALRGVLPLSEERWFPHGNGYLPNAGDRIEADSKAIPSIQRQNFARYMAGATFTHCGDAWGFLGRSLDSLLHGDVGGAVHLTYYAELRAALSLLAGEGIYVGNRTHFAISATGVHPFGGSSGTHSVAWKALQAWTDSSRSQDLLGTVIRPGGEPLADWLDLLTAQAARAKIDDLFGLMSLDLREFDQDHHRRNFVSYNPSRLHPDDLTAVQVRDLATDIWRALEPRPQGAFPVLDDALLPEFLRSIYNSIQRNTQWSDWVAELAPASQQGSVLLSALQASESKSEATGLVGAMNESCAAETNPVLYLRPMMARTVLLLRIATGSAIQLVRESGHVSTALRPWLDSLALSRGYWSDNSPLEDALDLWADIDLAINEAEVAGVNSLHDLLRGLLTVTHTFGQAERVPVWSFA